MFTQFENSDKWEQAFSYWINSFSAQNTKRAYNFAWKTLLSFTQKAPWRISRIDLNSWMNQMISSNLSPSTRSGRLAAVSSFYNYVINECTEIVDGEERFLHTVNPSSGKSLRVKVNPYGKANYLTKENLKKFLLCIDKDSNKGSRDYALFLAYIYTGRRNSEIRKLKFEDVENRSGTYWYRWSGKGKVNVCAELPEPVIDAIDNYITINKIEKSGYIFTSMRSRVQPLSMRETARCFKSYLQKSGFNPKLYHIHCLRHSAAMLRLEAGDDISKISAFLSHSSLAITQIYLHNIVGLKDESWKKVRSLLD